MFIHEFVFEHIDLFLRGREGGENAVKAWRSTPPARLVQSHRGSHLPSFPVTYGVVVPVNGRVHSVGGETLVVSIVHDSTEHQTQPWRLGHIELHGGGMNETRKLSTEAGKSTPGVNESNELYKRIQLGI